MIDVSVPTERFHGKFPGVVEKNQPQDAPDDFQGNILVKVSTILDERNQPVAVWAMPCFHPGFFFIPEKGDNVWVEFIGGDINHAVWTGVWYPKGKTPKTSSDDTPVTENKVIRTASGHVVELADTSGDEKVIIKHRSGAVVEMNTDGSVLIANGDSLSVELKGGEIKVSSSDIVQISAQRVEIAGGLVNIGSNATHPAVLGDVLVPWIAGHTHGSAVGPTSTPLPPVPPQGSPLSASVKVAT
jgi:hypothetical protein